MGTENFTTYAELDPSSDIAKTATVVTVTTMGQAIDARLRDDKGSGHFGATFDHDFELIMDLASHAAAVAVCYGVSNTDDDMKDWQDNNRQALYLFVYGTGYDVWLREADTLNSDTFAGAQSTTYYVTVQRTSSTAIEARFYSDAPRMNLLDTISIACTNGRTYQHLFVVNTYNNGENRYWSFKVSNLDLNEAGQPMMLRGTTVPHIGRQWHPRRVA